MFSISRISYFGGINSFSLILEGLEFSIIYPLSVIIFILAVISCTSSIQDKFNEKIINESDPATFSQILRCPVISKQSTKPNFSLIIYSSSLYYIILITQEKSFESLSIAKFYLFYVSTAIIFFILLFSLLFFPNSLKSSSSSSIGATLIGTSLILMNFFCPGDSVLTAFIIWLLSTLGFLLSSLTSINQIFVACASEMQFTNQVELYLKLCGLIFFSFGFGQTLATGLFYMNLKVVKLHLFVVFGVLTFVITAFREFGSRGLIRYDKIFGSVKRNGSRDISVSDGGLELQRT